MRSNRLRRVLVLAVVAGLLPGWGCASRPVLQRGWIGGEYEEVRASHFRLDPSSVDGPIHGLPEPIQKDQSGAVLVSGLRGETPLSEAGVREGDLLFRVDDKKISSIGDLRSRVDAASPGETVLLGVFRDGQFIEKPVRIGRESYRKSNAVSVGLRFSPEVSIASTHDISLLSVVGFKRGNERVSLQSPRVVYAARNVIDSKSPQNLTWDLWLGIFGLSGSEVIIKQETAGNRHDEIR